ncbi:MAG: Uma2 family endonuclease [Chitinophagaceae bacterium]
MSSAIKILPYYTYQDYCHWEGKWELIEGFPYAMSPAPIPKHQIVSLNLAAEFRAALKECSSCKTILPIDYKINEDTILQPDILVVCDKITKKFLDFPPALVVEILSPATAIKDRNTKYTIYESQQIPYYLIVDIDKEIIEVYQLTNGAYSLKETGNNFTYNFSLLHECVASIDFSQIWAA